MNKRLNICFPLLKLVLCY